jgi:hypothetical protein
MMHRRKFISVSTFALLGLPALRATGASAEEPERRPSKLRATIGNGTAVRGLHGDTWTTAWADDGELYAVADDSFGLKSKPINSNLAIFRLSGPPRALQIETINDMSPYGHQTSLLEDGASWKGSGLTCIGGVLYLAVSRHLYMDAPYGWIQQSWDASLVKSDDHGKTWSAAPQLGRAMFPGRLFSNPYFVQYGRDGAAGPDDSDRFVYATSNDGVWNNGNSMTLGRVARSRIDRLDPADWEFVHRFDKAGAPVWGPRHDNAIATFRSPGRTSMAGIQYNAALGLYMLPQWYYPDLGDPAPERRWQHSRFEFYSAQEPWGPWTLFHSQDFSPQGYYTPGIPGKFISDDGLRAWILASGDFYPSSDGNPFYTINMLPLSLEAAA